MTADWSRQRSEGSCQRSKKINEKLIQRQYSHYGNGHRLKTCMNSEEQKHSVILFTENVSFEKIGP